MWDDVEKDEGRMHDTCVCVCVCSSNNGAVAAVVAQPLVTFAKMIDGFSPWEIPLSSDNT